MADQVARDNGEPISIEPHIPLPSEDTDQNPALVNDHDDNASTRAVFGPRQEFDQVPNWRISDQVSTKLYECEPEYTQTYFESYRIHAVAFEMTEGDTLVFIDMANNIRATGKKTDCNGIAYHPVQLRVHADRLLATGSSKFAEMLAPTYQFRVMRRRKLTNNLPEGVKYVLDLSPPSEGDELVFQMTELSLTPGIIKWWSAELLHEVDAHLVSGHDDICACAQDADNRPPDDMLDDGFPSPSEAVERDAAGWKIKKQIPKLPLNPDFILQMKARGENEHFRTPPFRKIPDYCPTRHRNAIVRLLMFIEGKGLILNSASRVWTLVKMRDRKSVV